MSSTTTEHKIGTADIEFYDGVSDTFTRLTSTGGTLTLNKVGTEVNVAEAYGSGTISQTALIDAVNYIGTRKRTIILKAGTWTISADQTISSNITLKPEAGAILSVATGKTLTVNGPIDAGPYQIFSGAGTISLATNNSIKEVLAEWWGAVPDGSTDSTTALQAALTTGKPLHLLTGVYKQTIELYPAENGVIFGDGSQSILYRSTAALGTGSYLSGLVPYNYVTIRNCTLRGPGSASYTASCNAVQPLYNDSGWKDPGSVTDRNNTAANWRGYALTVENCVVENWPGDGIGGGPYSNLRNNIVQNNYMEGILVHGDGVQIVNNRVSNSASWGIDCNGDTPYVSGNIVTNCGNKTDLQTAIPDSYDGGGIVVYAGTKDNGITSGQIINNTVDTSDFQGIQLVTNADTVSPAPYLKNILVRGNIVKDTMAKFYEAMGTVAVYDNSDAAGTIKARQIIIENNIIQTAGGDYATYGIIARSANGISIRNNQIYDVSADTPDGLSVGIYVEGFVAGPCYDVDVSGNEVDTVDGDAIKVDGGTGIISKASVVNNTALNFAGMGAQCAYVEDLQVQGNRFHDPTGETAYSHMISVYQAYNYQVQNNICHGVVDYYEGIYIGVGAVEGQVQNNICRDCYIGVNYNSTGIGYTTFTGSGLDDAYYTYDDGPPVVPYSGTSSNSLYEVEIESTGTPDVFKFRKDGGSWDTSHNISAGDNAVAEDVLIHFGASTGHTVGDNWSVRVGGGCQITGNKNVSCTTAINVDGAIADIMQAWNPGVALPEYADNSAAVAAGLPLGAPYKDTGTDTVQVVHA